MVLTWDLTKLFSQDLKPACELKNNNRSVPHVDLENDLAVCLRCVWFGKDQLHNTSRNCSVHEETVPLGSSEQTMTMDLPETFLYIVNIIYTVMNLPSAYIAWCNQRPKSSSRPCALILYLVLATPCFPNMYTTVAEAWSFSHRALQRDYLPWARTLYMLMLQLILTSTHLD